MVVVHLDVGDSSFIDEHLCIVQDHQHKHMENTSQQNAVTVCVSKKDCFGMDFF